MTMTPYRGNGELPRVLFEGPLYPRASEKNEKLARVRVVLTKDGKIVETMTAYGAMGEPCWTAPHGAYQSTVITALLEHFQ